MSRLIFPLLVTWLIACLSTIPGYCEELKPETIRVATPEWESVTEADGTGAYFDLLRAIYEPLGIRMTYKIVPFKRALFTVTGGDADAFPGCYYTQESMGYYHPRYPLSGEEMATFFKRDAADQWQGQASLTGKRVISLRGYGMDAFLDVPVEYWEIDRTNQGVRLITVGRHDFFINDRSLLEKAVAELEIDMNRYRIETVIQRYSYLCFGKTEASKTLIKLYDQRFPKLLEEGVIEKLWKQYGFPMTPLEPRDGEYDWEK